MRFTPSHVTLGTCIRFLGACALIGFILWYVQFQARNFLQGPEIVLNDTGSALHYERIISLTGNTRNIVKLTLNGREIHTDETGAFVQKLVLEDGYTIMTLNAHDRFGRSTSVTREYVYSPISLQAQRTSIHN